MKNLLLLMLFVTVETFAQRSSEFKIYPNGLIYDNATMDRLSDIVRSQNVKFKSCELSHPYYSLPQGFASFVDIPSEEARKLIRGGISFEEYAKRFPKSISHRHVWVVKYKFRNYENARMISYSGLPGGEQPQVDVAEFGSADLNSGWVESDDWEDGRAIYIEKLCPVVIPTEYARLIQYVDCMVDTTAQIYIANTHENRNEYAGIEKRSSGAAYLAWADDFPGEPTFPESEKMNRDDYANAYSNYTQEFEMWDSLRMVYVDAEMKKKHWRNLLMEASASASVHGDSDERLEFFVARYISKEDALCLKRSRRVTGACSMDQRPRIHAMEICQLAAETANWDIFLRSHLDIMNDNFSRDSDGSYAWARRKTYLKELEALDINAIDLLLGTSLRTNDVSENHYLSSIGRVGRALADVENKNELESRLLSMINNNSLDAFNRLLVAYLFNNYIHNLDDASHRNACSESLDAAMKKQPEFIRAVWKTNG